MTEESPTETIRRLRAQIAKLNDERKDPQGVARIMSGYCNTLSSGRNKEFVEEMSYEHRTLQQSFTRLCVAWLEHLGSLDDVQYDLRNEDSVNLGREFVEKIQNRHLSTV